MFDTDEYRTIDKLSTVSSAGDTQCRAMTDPGTSSGLAAKYRDWLNNHGHERNCSFDIKEHESKFVHVEENLPPLEKARNAETFEFLARWDEDSDYGKCSRHFPKMKEELLELHFDIASADQGAQRIELPDHPLRGSDLAELLPKMGRRDEHDEPRVKQGEVHTEIIARFDCGRDHDFVTPDKLDWSSLSLTWSSSEDIFSLRSDVLHERSGAQRVGPDTSSR